MKNSSAVPRVGRSRWNVALGVSFLALLALALVPAILERQEAALERELAVFSLARPMFREIQVVLSQERTSIEQYLSLGDSSSLEIYQDNASREADLAGGSRAPGNAVKRMATARGRPECS